MVQIDVDLDLLRCFVTVAAERNFTIAGDKLGRSQSAVSVRIKKLEELLGVKLLNRNSREVKLTQYGQKLLPKAYDMLYSGEHLLASMRKPAITGSLRIGLLEYIAPHRIPEIITLLQRKLPAANLSFRVGLSGELLSALDAGKIDIAIALYDAARSDFVALGYDQLVWVQSLEHRKVSSDASIALCLMQAPCAYRSAALDTLEQIAHPYTEIMTANSILAVYNAIASGLGVSVLGTSCLGHDTGDVGPNLDLPNLPRLTLGLYGTDKRKSTLLETFREVLNLPIN